MHSALGSIIAKEFDYRFVNESIVKLLTSMQVLTDTGYLEITKVHAFCYHLYLHLLSYLSDPSGKP